MPTKTSDRVEPAASLLNMKVGADSKAVVEDGEGYLKENPDLSQVLFCLFKLRYKKSPGVPTELIFSAPSFEEAAARARKYCDAHRHKFIGIEHFVKNLEELTE